MRGHSDKKIAGTNFGDQKEREMIINVRAFTCVVVTSIVSDDPRFCL